jgi:UDP-glucose 4-epimerase
VRDYIHVQDLAEGMWLRSPCWQPKKLHHQPKRAGNSVLEVVV